MEQWKRFIDSGTAGQSSADTTETQIGTGITVPNWSRSILQAVLQFDLITMTTAENVSGYFRLTNDNNTLDPLNFPLPVVPANLAGAAAGQMHFPVTVPCFHNVAPNDIVRAYFALDVATTGVHVVDGYVLFSDQPAPMQLKAQKTAATAGGDALTDSTAVNIETLADKTKDLIGIWGYVVSTGTVVAAESIAGHVLITSNLKDWQSQQLPLNVECAPLGADSYIITEPVIYTNPQMWPYFDGFHKRLFNPVHVGTRQAFTCKWYNDRDIDDNIDPKYRVGLIWRE